ncbi:MAG: trypsin-like serine protease, partial [Polyangiaceae bacterium]
SSATRYSIANVAPFPGYHATNTCPNPTIDVALMQLSAPVDGVTPLSLGNGLPSRGDQCTAVGYGRHSILSDVSDTDASPVVLTTQVEQKRDATEVVTQIGSTTVEVTYGTGLADHGDSGGPLLCGGAIAATVSCHTDGDYPTHQNEFYARIDGIAGWITAMESNFDPSAPWPPAAATDDAGSADDAVALSELRALKEHARSRS